MSAELVHPLGLTTVQDWLDEAPPPDGSKRELILGNIRVSPIAAGEHQILAYRLTRCIDDTLRDAGRTDLFIAPPINVKISSIRQTAVIPDIAILNTPVVGVLFTPAQVELVVEVWSPGNSRVRRLEKFDAYAYAGIRYFWTVELDGPVVNAFELRGGQYRRVGTLQGGTTGTITAAPVPVTFDPAELLYG